MITVIAIGGEPATGKSTLMKALIAKLGTPNAERKAGLMRYRAYPKHKALVLGGYEEEGGFPGTDRLAMNAQPAAEMFITTLQTAPQWDGTTVLFEGDRLFNAKFLRHIASRGARLFTLVLVSSQVQLALRHVLRADTQDETWLKGRATKVKNVTEQFGATRLEHNTPEDTRGICEQVLAIFVKEEQPNG